MTVASIQHGIWNVNAQECHHPHHLIIFVADVLINWATRKTISSGGTHSGKGKYYRHSQALPQVFEKEDTEQDVYCVALCPRPALLKASHTENPNQTGREPRVPKGTSLIDSDISGFYLRSSFSSASYPFL